MNDIKKISLNNHLEELEKLNRKLSFVKTEWELSDNVFYNVSLALEEIVTNIIKYAFQDISAHSIEISLMLFTDYVEVDVCDDGIEFNPLDQKEPDLDKPLEERNIGGLGIHLVKNITDEIVYERFHYKNHLRFKKYLNSEDKKHGFSSL